MILRLSAFALLLGLLGPARPAAAEVRIGLLSPQTWDDFAPGGKEVDAIYGDLVIRNEHVIAVVAQPKGSRKANMTVGSIGGQLIDLTTPDSQSDQLSAFYVGRRRYPFNDWSVRDVAGERTLGWKRFSKWSGKDGAIVVRSPATADRPGVETRYRLTDGARFLEITTTYTAVKAMTLQVEDDVRIDSRNETIRFSRNGVHDLAWAEDRYWGQGYGFELEGGRIESTTSRGLVLRYRAGDGDGSVKLEPKGTHTVVSRVFPAKDMLGVRANVAARADRPTHETTLAFEDGKGRPLPGALLSLKQGNSVYGSARTDAKGRIVTRLPAGDYTGTLTTLGLMAGTYDIEIEEGTNLIEESTFLAPGVVRGRIVDGDGKLLPAKVAFRAKEGTTDPDFGPHSGEGSVGNLVYCTSGEFERTIGPGEYDVIVSRGPEYDAEFTTLTVEPGGEAELKATLPRVIDSTGWVSADFHSHSSPSGDNTGSQRGRVENLVCEHIEFAPCTEHNRISTYDGHIADLGIERFIRTVSGMELTGQPLPLNHQNTFPLILKPRTQDGGGPVTDTNVERQVERLALWDDRSHKLLQQNHPDIGWLFYDANGDGTPDDGHPRILPHVDVMEIHPLNGLVGMGPVDLRSGKPFGNSRVFNWLQMLNQGHRIKGVVNTDAHYNYHGSGGLRNWIRSATDDPAKIDVDQMVTASEQGRLVMSNGPMIDFSVRRGMLRYGLGDDVPASDGKVEVSVKVQCANWVEIDRVYLLANGRVLKEFDFGPNDLKEGVVRFERTATLTFEKDVHLEAVAVGEKSKLGDVMGPFWGSHHPAAITNPIWIDVDGGGFDPNRDTLGSPLPVKFRK